MTLFLASHLWQSKPATALRGLSLALINLLSGTTEADGGEEVSAVLAPLPRTHKPALPPPPLDIFLDGTSLLDTPPLTPPLPDPDLINNNVTGFEEEEDVRREPGEEGGGGGGGGSVVGSKLASLEEEAGSSGTSSTRDRIAAALRPVREKQQQIVERAAAANTSDQGTITDVCSKENVAEVELISLVQDQLPRYTLRADTLTSFSGYEHSDWASRKHVQQLHDETEDDVELSQELIEETLKYFILCSERLGQMTKTYNDIECVTRLLEEKERDLELAARIGQSLLEKNKNVEAKNDRLQAELDDALEKIRQLRHELVAKEALLHIYSQDEDSPSPVLECSGGLGNPLLANMELLQNKVKALEMENLQLTVDKTSLKTETLDLEQKEAGLMKDCVKQLSDANDVIHGLQEELALKAEDEAEKHLQIVFLQGKINTMEQERMSFAAEQAELQKHLGAAKEAQRELTSELGDLEQRYDECMALLVESQEDNKTLRKKSRPSAIHQHYGTTPFYMPEGSLAMELERSMHSEEEMPEGHKPQQRRSRNGRVMATARAVRLATSRTNSQASLHSLAHVDADASNRSSMYLSDADSYISDGGGGGDNSLSMLGRAGVPGSNDLETALRNLSMKKANDINDQQFLHDREDKKKAIPESDDGLSGFASGWTTPESYMSLGSGSTDLSRASSFRMPEKLQIVKPLAGSATLHQWQRLATNRDLHGLLEARPLGVQTKTDDPESGGAGEQEVYSLSDYEEDEEYCPNRADNEVSGTYTYTTSKIMHPTDHYLALNGAGSSSSKGTVLTTSVSTSQQSLSFPHSSSRQTSQQSGGTSTFSMSWGLAKELQERSISPRGLLANPPRFMAISSETRASDLGASHAQPAYSNASLFVSPICGVNTDSAGGGTDASNSPMRYRPENAYLNLVDKIKDLGLTNIMDIAEGSSLIPRSQNNAVDVGLNSVTFMKRQSFFRFQRRAGKYVGPPSSVVVSDTQTISTTEQSPGNQTSLINQTSYSNQTISKNQDTGVTQSTERAYKISPPSSNAGFAELPSYMCPVPGSASIAIGRPGKTTYSSSSTTSQVVNGGGKSASLASLSSSSSSSTTTNGSVSSIPSLAELTNSSNSNSNNSMSRSNSAGRLSSILEAPSLEGIATRGTMGMVAVAGLKATPTFFQKKAAKKS